MSGRLSAFLVVLVFLFGFSFAYTTVSVNSCAVLTDSNVTYELDVALLNSSITCINLSSVENVIFDCKGGVINYTGTSSDVDMGILVSDSSNVTIRNCRIENWTYSTTQIGLKVGDSTGVVVRNTTFYKAETAINITGDSSISVSNSSMDSFNLRGIYADSEVSSVAIDDAYFNGGAIGKSGVLSYAQELNVTDSTFYHTAEACLFTNGTSSILRNDFSECNLGGASTAAIYLAQMSATSQFGRNNITSSVGNGVQLYRSNNTEIYSNYISGLTWSASSSASGIYSSESFNTAIYGNNISDTQLYGIYVGSPSGTCLYCPSRVSTVIENNSLSSSITTYEGISLQCANYSTIENNIISGYSRTAFYVIASTDLSFSGNSVTNSGGGVEIYVSSNIMVRDSSFNSITAYSNNGVWVENGVANVTVENCTFSDVPWGVYAWGGPEPWTKPPMGVCIYPAPQNVFVRNSHFEEGTVGIALSITNSQISGNYIADMEDYGIVAGGVTNITNNSLSYIYGSGIYMYYAVNSTARDNSIQSVTGLSSCGIDISNSINTSAYGNSITESTGGICVDAGQNITLTRNSVDGSGVAPPSRGIYIATSTDSTLLDNRASGFEVGIYIGGTSSGIFLANSTTYNNYADFYVYRSNYLMETSYFLNPAGTLERYTVLSIEDASGAKEGYIINWTSISPPSGNSSFANKWVDIMVQTGTPSIDKITWHWTNAEASGHNEDSFGLWKYSESDWTALNQSPDTVANTLTAYSLNPASTYGILMEYEENAPEENGGTLGRPECNSDSDCNACAYCSIANKKCVLREASQCINDSGCSALGGGYTCAGCTCTAPECVDDSDCARGYECNSYYCIEEEKPETTEEGEPQEGETTFPEVVVTPTEEEPSQPVSPIISVDVPTVSNPQQETPETNVISGQLLLGAGLIILLIAIAAIYLLKKKAVHKKGKKGES